VELYFLKKDEFLDKINLKSLENFSDGRKYSSQDKYYEHLCGLFLVKFVAKNIYNLKNIDIEIVDKKPYFKSREKFFSISHSKNIVLVAFSDKNIGADIEYLENRDYKSILKRYNKDFETATLEDFYKFWTIYESKIKLKTKEKYSQTLEFEQNYVLSCLSEKAKDEVSQIKQIFCKASDIDLKNEFEKLKNISIKDYDDIFEI
jgi:phosphopantetheinyl transferase